VSGKSGFWALLAIALLVVVLIVVVAGCGSSTNATASTTATVSGNGQSTTGQSTQTGGPEGVRRQATTSTARKRTAADIILSNASGARSSGKVSITGITW
jgi:hypothetical protein